MLLCVLCFLCGPILVPLFALASFELSKRLFRGLRNLRRMRFSLGQVFAGMVVCAIWMAVTRSSPPLLILGLVGMVLIAILSIETQQSD